MEFSAKREGKRGRLEPGSFGNKEIILTSSKLDLDVHGRVIFAL